MKREFRLTIGDDLVLRSERPIVDVLGTVELANGAWQATIVPHEGAPPRTCTAEMQIDAVLGCLRKMLTDQADEPAPSES